jgi:hypothetical protein
MSNDTHISSLEQEIEKRQGEIFAKEQNMAIIKEGLIRDKKILKILQDGLSKMKPNGDQENTQALAAGKSV